MMKQKVQFVFKENVTQTHEFFEQFELRKDKPFVFAQKVCFWLLRKLGAFVKEEKTVSTRTLEINTEVFLVRLYAQQKHLLAFYDLTASEILMGSIDYAEMMKEQVQLFPFQFVVTTQTNVGRTTSVCGLTVKVIPWMSGVLIMPSKL